MVTSKNQRKIVVSRIMEREAVSLSHPLISGWYGRGRASLSISHVFVGGEAGLRPWLVPRKSPPKKLTHGEFLNYRNWVSSCSFFTGWRRIRSCLFSLKNQQYNLGYERNPNSKLMPSRERIEKKKLIIWLNSALRGMVSLVKPIPKEQTCPREEEKLLILVLSEIRRVSFYQRGMETQ